MLIYLVELTAYDPAAAATRVLRYASGAGYVTGPTASPSHTWYDPRIIEPASFERFMFSDARTAGASRVGFGELVLNNIDGALDFFTDLGFDRRAFTLRLGDDGAAYPAGFVTVLAGTIDQVELSWRRVAVRLRDRQAELDKALQATKYAGTNVGPAGVEGTADDIAGRPKPLALGQCLNVPAVPVNTSSQIFQVHDGQLSAITAVYDVGVALVATADYPTLAALQAATVAAGRFATCLSLGLFRVGSPPVGTVTADVQGDAVGGYVARAGDLAERVAIRFGGLVSGDILAGTVAAMNAANSATLGLYVTDEKTARAALDDLVGSVGGWWGFDRLGRFQLGRLTAPSGTPAATFGDLEIVGQIERQAASDQGGGIPAWRVFLDYGVNWTVQTGDQVAGSVTAARRAWLEKSTRRVEATRPAIKTKHLGATELERSSLIVFAAAATAEAGRLADLYSVRRDTVRCRVRLDAANAGSLDLGAVVSLQLGRFGYDAGRLFVVTGLAVDARVGALSLTLWG